MEIFLHDDVAAAGEGRVFVADEHGVDRCLASGILRPVDETEEIAVVEIAEALHLVHRRNGVAEARHDLRGQLEAQIHALGADVEQQVARRGDGMARSGADLPERMQLRRPRRPKEPVPRVGPEPHDAGESAFEVAKFHRAQQRGEVAAERAHGVAIFGARVDRHDQKDRGAGERRGDRLREGRQANCRFGRARRIGFHWVSVPQRAQNFRTASLPSPANDRPTQRPARLTVDKFA